MWTRWERPRALASVTTQAPCCTGPRSTRRQPCATTAPARSGRRSCHGGGADRAAAASAATTDASTVGGRGAALGKTPSTPLPVVAVRGARIAATPFRVAPSATVAAAPTAALAINVRRESIVHPPATAPRFPRRDSLLDTILAACTAATPCPARVFLRCDQDFTSKPRPSTRLPGGAGREDSLFGDVACRPSRD